MDGIRITDLSSQVLDAMKMRNLKAKSIKEFEHYGLRRIISHFLEHGWTTYSEEAVWAFVLQERTRMENGQLPVDAMLPFLSAYMGHARFEDTAYYIHMIPDLYQRIRKIDVSAYERLLPEVYHEDQE